MAKFNPNAIGTVGNEWRAWFYGNDRQEPVAASIHSSATESIDSILMPYVSSGAQSSQGKVLCEVYSAGDLGLGETPVTYTYLPNEDVAVYNTYFRPIGGALTGPVNTGASDLDQYINDLVDEGSNYLPNLATLDYLSFPAGGYARFALDTAALPAGRVLSVQVEARYLSRSLAGSGVLGIDLYNGVNAVYRMLTISVSPVTGQDQGPAMGTTTSSELFINPATSLPWTRADVVGMDSGANLTLQLVNVNGTVYVMALRLKVKMISEKRVAVGANTLVSTLPSGLNTTNWCVMSTPAGADNWAKANGVNYLIVMRRIVLPTSQLPAQDQYYARIDSGAPNPENQGQAYAITLYYDGRLATVVGPETSAHAVLMTRFDGTLSVDCQPYHSLHGAPVYNGMTANQRISGHGSTSYQTVRAIIGTNQGVTPGANLTFQVRRVSDNAVMGGGAATLTPARLTEHPFLANYLGVSWYDVQIDLSANATLVAGTAYYVEAASTAAFASRWIIWALDETHGYVNTPDQSFGGTTDYAFLEGGTQSQMDLALTITVPPPTGPASITVGAQDYALPDNGGAMCSAGVHQFVRISWATTAEGVLFSYYEIQRSEDNAASWSTIKRVMSEATLTFDDMTAARGVLLKYRVRTIRTNGQASTWRTQGSTTTLIVNTESVVFATNEDPTLTTGYIWLNPEHNYEFLSDREVNVLQLHGRDYNVVYRALEDRGVMYTFDLLIYTRDDETDCGGTPPAGKGAAAFNKLRAIAESDAPSIAVFTPMGNRIFAGVRLPGGKQREEAALYETTVQAIEVAKTEAVTVL